jgi:hypothetical protein
MDKETALNTITGLLNLNCVEDNTETWRFAEQLIQTYERFWDASVPAETLVRQGEVQPVLRTEIEEKYNELIMAVAEKFTNETRHETALRYINEAESFQDNSCSKNESGNLPNGVAIEP